jgi:Fe(3+) dicitrate transport protein
MHSLVATVDVEHPVGAGGQVAMYYVSSQFADANDTRAVDATGQFGLIPAHAIVDANAHYKWKKTGLTFRLVVKDALNELYVSERRPQGIAVGGFREILLGVRWDWEAKPAE